MCVHHLQVLQISSCAIDGLLPAAWGSQGSFPSLQELELGNNTLSGRHWPQVAGLCCVVGCGLALLACASSKSSILLPSWQSCGSSLLQPGQVPSTMPNIQAAARCRLAPLASALPRTTGTVKHSRSMAPLSPPADLGSSGITKGCLPAGTLPQQWGDSGSLAQLQVLGLSGNQLAGTLPAQWGVSQTAMPGLQVLELANNSLTGSLPPQWGTEGFQVSGRAIINSIVTCSKQVDSAKKMHRCLRCRPGRLLAQLGGYDHSMLE